MDVTDPGEETEQGLLPVEVARTVSRKARPPKAKPPPALAERDPVARVLVDVPLAHLDRPFDYLVPEPMASDAVPGARVKVRFAGQDVDGFVLERTAESAHTGRLQPLRRVVSPEPVLAADVARLLGLVAERYAGTRSDVLRLAVPSRHASTEKEPSTPAPTEKLVAEHDRAAHLPGAVEALDALASGQSPRLVWTVPPGDDWTAALVEAVVANDASGRGSIVCVPDQRDLARLDAALAERLGAGRHVTLTADLGPAKRYRSFLAAARGAARIVIGTRAAAFAPVRDLGLVAIWDDGDDLFDEPRAPYPHAREVLLLRAQDRGCATLLAAHARSVEAEYLLRTGWASEVVAPRDLLRERVSVAVTGDSDQDLARDPHTRAARMPREVFEIIREASAAGPVLVQTPRAGYATRLACERCRTPATCAVCHGPLRITGSGAPPTCAWCATAVPGWTCATCAHRGLRAPVLGDLRTAEEIGRALPLVTVRTSSGDKIVSSVPARPCVVVATPGAEPVADGGYTAVVLLDTWLSLLRPDLRAAEEAVRRWSNAAALARPGSRVLLVGDPANPALQAMVRWDPAGFARREIAERQSAHLPPASRVATLTLDPEDLEGVLEWLHGPDGLPPGAEVLGPVPVLAPVANAVAAQQRLVLRVPRSTGPALSAALTALQVHRSTRKLSHVRVEVDPAELG